MVENATSILYTEECLLASVVVITEPACPSVIGNFVTAICTDCSAVTHLTVWTNRPIVILAKKDAIPISQQGSCFSRRQRGIQEGFEIEVWSNLLNLLLQIPGKQSISQGSLVQLSLRTCYANFDPHFFTSCLACLRPFLEK